MIRLAILFSVASFLFSEALLPTTCAQELSRKQSDLFEIYVRPVLVKHCIECHSESKQEGDLNLTTLAGIMTGGESGAAIEPGKPAESLIIEALKYDSLEMPPAGKLDDGLIAGIEQWIQAGAPWPEDVVLKASATIEQADRDWWCFQPIADPTPPASDDAWCLNPIDQFVLAKLSEHKLQPARQADAITLVRRLSFAVTGLPPDADLLDLASQADFDFEAAIDRLLDKESYGENQARFWLDLVRYADSDGYRADHSRPEAYRYRDYVIKSFNEDKPYDRFIKEQLAGDEIDPGNREALIATMYLRHWIYEHNQRDVEGQWHEILSDITETTSDVFLAQGLKCARCHDHKFDPLLQKDYFRFKAFFAAFQPSENQPVADIKTRAAYQKQKQAWEQATLEIRRRIREIEFPVLLNHATREGFKKFVPEIKAMILKWPADREPYEEQIASLASRQFDLPHDKLYEWLSNEQQKEHKALKEELKSLEHLKPKPLPSMKFVGADVGPIAPVTFIPDDKQKTPISPGFLTLLDPTEARIQTVPEALQSTGRRTTLANWIASPSNPLTARVMVNRIWQQHFGKGLVDTSSDFGHLGTLPTHPELLDWLASRFIKDGWSIKKLHRLILSSATYRQTSMRPMTETIKTVDPNNRLLWRVDPRRLSGEEVTDSVLTASGELKKQKRSVYRPVRRNSLDPLLAAFDAPDRIRSMGKRHRTTTSTQALLLANGSWAHERADAIARRLSEHDQELMIQSAYRLLFGRHPSQEEALMADAFLEQYKEVTPIEEPPTIQTLVKMPGNGGLAVNLKPGGPVSMSLKSSDSLPDNDFTVEAVIVLRSLYPDASVRSIVAHWNGSKSRAGWSLGVTSAKSAFKPRNLILQLVGTPVDGGKLHYEVVASNLRPELNKPYYVAASVDLDDGSESGITFYMKDLSKKDSKLLTASAKHVAIKNIRPQNDLTIGDRFGKHQWDGLIDSIRIQSERRDLSRVAQAESADGLPDYVVDWQFESRERLGKDSSGNGNHAWAKVDRPKVQTRAQRARVALIHALLNSNELIYVD